MRDLYHGTVYDIEKIDVTKGKGYKDFGLPEYVWSMLKDEKEGDMESWMAI